MRGLPDRIQAPPRQGNRTVTVPRLTPLSPVPAPPSRAPQSLFRRRAIGIPSVPARILFDPPGTIASRPGLPRKTAAGRTPWSGAVREGLETGPEDTGARGNALPESLGAAASHRLDRPAFRYGGIAPSHPGSPGRAALFHLDRARFLPAVDPVHGPRKGNGGQADLVGREILLEIRRATGPGTGLGTWLGTWLANGDRRQRRPGLDGGSTSRPGGRVRISDALGSRQGSLAGPSDTLPFGPGIPMRARFHADAAGRICARP